MKINVSIIILSFFTTLSPLTFLPLSISVPRVDTEQDMYILLDNPNVVELRKNCTGLLSPSAESPAEKNFTGENLSLVRIPVVLNIHAVPVASSPHTSSGTVQSLILLFNIHQNSLTCCVV